MNSRSLSNDRILVHGMEFYGYHGVNPDERIEGQRFVVDVEVNLDLSTAGRSDNLDDTVNYTDLYQLVKEILEKETYDLLESVAETIAQRILTQFPVTAVLARVKKPSPPIENASLKWVAVEIHRMR